MADILSSKLVTLKLAALALILLLCVSNCVSINTPSIPCIKDLQCQGGSGNNYCYLGKCCFCQRSEGYFMGKCKNYKGQVTNNCDSYLKEDLFQKYGIAIIFALVVIGGIVGACCCFCPGCRGYKWRKQNFPPEPPAQPQPNVNPNPVPAQNPSQSQQSIAPIPIVSQYPSNTSVQGGYVPPQYPYPYQQQQQYPYPNMNPNYGQYPNQYPAPPPPPPPPYYSQYPNQYPAPPPTYSQYPNPNVPPVQANAPAQPEAVAAVPVSSPTTKRKSKNGQKNPQS